MLLYSVSHSWHMTHRNSLRFKKPICHLLLFYNPLKPFKFRTVSVPCVSVLGHYSVSSLLQSCTGNASLSLLGVTAAYSELSRKRPVCLCFQSCSLTASRARSLIIAFDCFLEQPSGAITIIVTISGTEGQAWAQFELRRLTALTNDL